MVNKKSLETIKDTDLIGIEWKAPCSKKSVLIREYSITCNRYLSTATSNKDYSPIGYASKFESHKEFLKNFSYRIKKAYIFKDVHERHKWFLS